MSTDTAKTTQQERWVVRRDAERGVVPGECVFDNLSEFSLVRRTSVSGIPDTLDAAMHDPANVYKVDAYPAVVEALESCVQLLSVWKAWTPIGCTAHSQFESLPEITSARTALASVHPAVEGAKT